jgi:hypothetical protein
MKNINFIICFLLTNLLALGQNDLDSTLSVSPDEEFKLLKEGWIIRRDDRY